MDYLIAPVLRHTKKWFAERVLHLPSLLITTNPGEYVAKAAALAGDPGRLSETAYELARTTRAIATVRWCTAVASSRAPVLRGLAPLVS